MPAALRLRAALVAVCVTVTVASGRSRAGRDLNDVGDKALWEKEYENELNDALQSPRSRGNASRARELQPAPAADAPSDSEAVIEKLMESITSSEQYLKKLESIDFRLNRLDIEVHEKTDTIAARLAELAEASRGARPLANVQTQLDHIVSMLENNIDNNLRSNSVDGGVAGAGAEGACASLERRLARVEGAAASAARGAQAVLAVMEQVQGRQQSLARGHAVDLGAEAATLLTELKDTLRRYEHEGGAARYGCSSGGVERARARAERLPSDCSEIQQQGFNVTGIYKICPEADADGGGAEPFYVLCELGDEAGGGWTVFQNRFDGSQDFYRGWSEYKHGFGNLAGEFWLGLDKLRRLTAQRLYELRVELEARAHDAHGHSRTRTAHATYSVFALGPEREGYRICTLGSYRGTAGDSLSYHAGQPFSTRDADRDGWADGACAEEHGGAWWYKECDKSNLNGRYSPGAALRAQAAYWVSFAEPAAGAGAAPGAPLALSGTRMMIRSLPPTAPAPPAA